MLAGQNLRFAIDLATVVVPVSLYFLILGLLNSRRHPQVLPGRLDFALLIGALSPLFAVPVLRMVGFSAFSVLAAVGAVACAILVLAPRGQTWVVYNASASEARRAVESALSALGLRPELSNGVFHLPAD